MTRFSPTRIAASLALVGAALPAAAVDFKAGDWDLNIGGIVNAYYTYSKCKGDQAIDGAALATKALGCQGKDDSTIIGNGLLPNVFSFGGSTKQGGFDITTKLGLAYAISNSTQVGNNSNVDVRQGYLTVGRSDIGTFKLGRDYGLFGSNAILSDITLLGTGATVAATQRNRVTLGHIGAGYTYLGTYGQMVYTTPDASGFTLSVGLMSPIDGTLPADGTRPQLQLLASFVPMEGSKVWAGFKNQKFKALPDTSGESYSANNYEIGGKIDYAGFGLMANYQGGKALGVLEEGDSGNAKQDNWIVQGTFNATPDVKLGLSYGESKVKDNLTGFATSLEKNSNLTAGVYYKLTPALTLVGEYGRTESKAFGGAKATIDGLSLGAIFFF